MYFNGDSDNKKCEMVLRNYHVTVQYISIRLDGVLVASAQKEGKIRLVIC